MTLDGYDDDARPLAVPPAAPTVASPPGSDPSDAPRASIATIRTDEPGAAQFRRPRRRRRIFLMGIATVIVFAIAFAIGRSQSTTSTPQANSRETDPSGLVGLVVQPRDTTPDLTVRELVGGTQVDGQPTLDLCNGSYPSESLRVARLQDAAIDSRGRVVLSTEAVEYRNATSTAQAFHELKRVAATCPPHPVVSPLGEPTTTTKFSAPPDGHWPAVASVHRLAFSFNTIDESGQSQHSIAVYLRRGRYLLGIYFPRPDDALPAIDGQTTVAGITKHFATRLAHALPPLRLS